MAKSKNFAARAFDALIAGRERRAQTYLAQLERDYPQHRDRFTKR